MSGVKIKNLFKTKHNKSSDKNFALKTIITIVFTIVAPW